MKQATLLFKIGAAFLLTGGMLLSQTKQEIPKYEYKIEGEWILGPTLKWPLKGSDGSLWPSPEGSKLVRERWAKGQEAKLPADDMEAIRKVVSETLPKEKLKIAAVKKISEREYMVYGSWYAGSLASGGLWYVVVRSGNEWILIAHYQHLIS